MGGKGSIVALAVILCTVGPPLVSASGEPALTGTVLAIGFKEHTLLVHTGAAVTQIAVAPSAPIVDAQGRSVSLIDVRPGDQVEYVTAARDGRTEAATVRVMTGHNPVRTISLWSIVSP